MNEHGTETVRLAEAEREGGWHVHQAYYTGLVFSEPAVERIVAERVAAARADERERVWDAAGSMRSAVSVGPKCYQPAGWRALCRRFLDVIRPEERDYPAEQHGGEA